MKNRTVSLALALLTAFAPAAACVPEGIREASAVYAAEDIQLTAAEVALPAYPRAGETPDPAGCTVTAGQLESVRWIDMAEKRELTAADPFKEGHVCSFSAYILAPAGSSWASTSDGRPAVTVTCRAGDSVSEALSVMFNQLASKSSGVEFAGAALYILPALLVYLYFQQDILEGIQLTELK